MLDLEAIKARVNLKRTIWHSFYADGLGRKDITDLLGEVERLQRIEQAARAYVESYDKATYEGYDNLHEQERLWQLVGESEATDDGNDQS